MGESQPRQLVLVVEDEPLIRMTATEFLEEAGFDVVEAGDALEAIETLERRTDIRLVFTDIDMPRGMDGLRLAALIRDRWPPIEILVTSAHLPPGLDALPERCVFMPKPYTSGSVVDALRRLAA